MQEEENWRNDAKAGAELPVNHGIGIRKEIEETIDARRGLRRAVAFRKGSRLKTRP
jgi:hypothetical protein